jgi:hypothetical protein
MSHTYKYDAKITPNGEVVFSMRGLSKFLGVDEKKLVDDFNYGFYVYRDENPLNGIEYELNVDDVTDYEDFCVKDSELNSIIYDYMSFYDDNTISLVASHHKLMSEYKNKQIPYIKSCMLASIVDSNYKYKFPDGSVKLDIDLMVKEARELNRKL